MKIDGRLFLVVIMALALIPGACAITASTGGGDSISGSGTAQGNLATNGVQTTGFSVANGVMSDTENHWVEDTTGKHAEVGMSVDSATKLSFSYSLSPNKDKTIVSPQSSLNAQELLDVTNAKQIQANANARNGEGDQANVNVNILIGSITGYKNSATATLTQATASQSATSASGNQIIFNSWANNKELDNACPSLQVYGGSVAGYTTSETATKTKATASQSATSVSGDQIIFNSWANNNELDNACPSLYVYGGSVAGYTTSETATKTQATASQSATSLQGLDMGASSIASNAEGDFANPYFEVYGGSVAGYTTSETATKTQATASQSATSLQGLDMGASSIASNAEGDFANPYFEVYGGSVAGYTTSETATKTQATASQSAKSAEDDIYFGSYVGNNNGDNTQSLIYTNNGQLSGYSDKATAVATSSQVSPVINTATGSNIEGFLGAYTSEEAEPTFNHKIEAKPKALPFINTATGSNMEGFASNHKVEVNPKDLQQAEGYEDSETAIRITNGQLSGYSGTTTASASTTSQTSLAIKTATGNLVDLASFAQNTNLANEYLTDSDGNVYPIPTNYGGANFEVQTGSLANTKLQSTATSSNVAITPTLPTSIKTAIMLEPMNDAFTNYAGATDLGTTVFPDLVGSGYATLRYTDSGASSDKFQNLGQYNVVLVDSHMNSGIIGLSTINPSTKADYIPASQLNYKTSKKPLVILAGCDSFGGYPTTKSALAQAVSGAYLSGGYTDSVGTDWNNDYLSYFFDALSNGDTASAANTEANTAATNQYGTGTYYLPLVFYGNQLFTL